MHTHPAHIITRAVTIEDIDDLYLTWNGYINGSALYRRALREEMELRDVDPNELRDLFERAREQGYTKDEIVDEPEAVPETLREREQWVCWCEEERDGKPTKIPVLREGPAMTQSQPPC